MPPTILIVDDEKNILLTLKRALELAEYQTHVAGGGQLALELLAQKPVDAVLMDVRMPDLDGLEALQKMLALRPGLPIIMMSGHGTIETAVRATQLGARDFLEKPIETAKLLVSLRNALAMGELAAEVDELRKREGPSEMVGSSPPMQALYGLIRKAAPSEGRVLITGENGTGKELVARAIHQGSKRAKKPFVKLNCAAVPAELIESELFGHEKGAFTGALATRRGRFEQADGGTLFLDEVGDMPANMQAKLLRVLQEGELERVGGAETLRVDVRVIAATNMDLQKAISRGAFREDLYYRLNVVPMHVPPLRERKQDIPDLVRAFLAQACERNGYRQKTLEKDALAPFVAYDYPGNVRELRNLVERLAILCEGVTVRREDVEPVLPMASKPASAPSRPRTGGTYRDQIDQAEREILLAALEASGGNASAAAQMLELDRGSLYRRFKALGIHRGEE